MRKRWPESQNQHQYPQQQQQQQQQKQQQHQQQQQQQQQQPKKLFNMGEIVLATYPQDGKKYRAKIIRILRDGYVLQWLDCNEQTKVNFFDVS